MTYRPTAADFNALFRGKVYGNHDIFTRRSFADFVRRHDVDLGRAISTFDDDGIVGTIVFAQRGERAWLSLMGIRPALRGMGHGKRLFGAAVDAVRASGARSIEFEVVQRNAPAIAMYRSFGFRVSGELFVWARKPVRAAVADPGVRRFTEPAVRRITGGVATCWQREAPAVARGGALRLVRSDGAYAFVRVRDGNAVILDAGARDDRAARALIDALERTVREDVTLLNEPATSPLSVALKARGWRIVDRQHRMIGA